MAKNKNKKLKLKAKHVKEKEVKKAKEEIVEIKERKITQSQAETVRTAESEFIDFEPVHRASSPTIEQEQKPRPRDTRLEDSLRGADSSASGRTSEKKYDKKYDQQKIDYSNKPRGEERLYERPVSKEWKEVVLPKIENVTNLLPKRRQQQQIPMKGEWIPEQEDKWQVKVQTEDKYESAGEMKEELDWRKRERKIKKYEKY